MKKPAAALNTLILDNFAALASKDPVRIQSLVDENIDGLASDPGTGNPLGNGPTDTVFRLRHGIERFLQPELALQQSSVSASEVWVMFDLFGPDSKLFNHVPDGSNVLYMDGHVEFLRYRSAGSDTSSPTPPITPSLGSLVAELIQGLEQQF